MSQIILHQTPLEDLTAIIVNCISEQFKTNNLIRPEKEIKVLNREETAKILGVSLPTLNQWTKDGTIQGTRIGTRVRYRTQDIEDALKEINITSKRR